MTLNEQKNFLSTSEENGIKTLTKDDKRIYSVGISTGGVDFERKTPAKQVDSLIEILAVKH